MVDKPKSEKPKQDLSDDVIKRMREQLILGSGYGQPPKEHQFKKGQSGNPHGRPRGSPPDLSLSDQPTLGAARRVATKKIKLREGNKVKEVPAFEVFVDAIFSHGIKGNARYAGMMLDLIRTAEQAHSRETRQKTEFWRAYQSAAWQSIAESKTKGEEEPILLPHPDDIVFDPEEGPLFVGPFDAGEYKRMQETIRLRDLLIMQDALDQRSDVRLDGSSFDEPGGALLVAKLLDRAIPPRLQLTGIHIFVRQGRYLAISKRQLLKDLHQGWKKLGRPKPRGFVFPNQSHIVGWLEFVTAFTQAAHDGDIDIDAISRGEFDDACLDLLERHGYPVDEFVPSSPTVR